MGRSKYIFLVFSLLLSLIVFITSCTVLSNSSTAMNQTSSSNGNNTQPPTSTLLNSPTSISTTTSTPPERAIPVYSANLVTIPNYFWGANRIGVLFNNNNKDYYCRLNCVVRTHDANGNFKSDYSVKSDFIPNRSSIISVLPENFTSTSGLTINELKFNGGYPDNSNQFATLVVSNIHIETVKNSRNNIILAGSIFNTGTGPINPTTGAPGKNLKPRLITLQVLKYSADGDFTLAGADRLYPTLEAATSRSLGSMLPMPPPNETISFYTPLWQSISIFDSKNAIFDGKLTIVAPGS